MELIEIQLLLSVKQLPLLAASTIYSTNCSHAPLGVEYQGLIKM